MSEVPEEILDYIAENFWGGCEMFIDPEKIYHHVQTLEAKLSKAREALRAVDLDRTSSLRATIYAIGKILDEGSEG